MFEEVEPKVDFRKLEHKILRFWADTEAFNKLLVLNKRKKPWSFIDGPITANNPMGVHHAWGRTYKDLFRRYKSMRGYYDRYHNGFDVQGLWVEVEVEKELGFKSKRDIEAYGIAKFVKRCKQRALRCAAMQTEQSIRLGYWMNWDDPDKLRYLADCLKNPDQVITVHGVDGRIKDTVEQIVGKLGSRELGGSYFTFSNENNYMIWTFLKKCQQNGWIYKGADVMPWCPRCSTGISQHEILTDGYRELTHVALMVRFPLRDRPNESLLVWTTTPWTLTSNVAAAVNPDLEYVKVKYRNEFLYMSKMTAKRTLPEGNYTIIEELKGQDMESWAYDGPFDELSAEKDMGAVKSHRVILWKEVSEEEGTGIVHIAPGCGKEDLELGKIYGLPAVSPLNEYGVFVEGFGKFTGVSSYESAPLVIDDLKKKGLLFSTEEYTHRYPVCWRCGNELVFRLVDEWFIRMGERLGKPFEQITEEEKGKNLRYRIMESAKQVRWIPQFGLLQELNWLENMEDWMISKKRYWGLALPIWACSKCKNFEVIGSKVELEERAVEGWKVFEGHTPHRPWIDAVKIKCSECGALASRIPDVGNPWLDAGIVAYSTLDYRHDREYWMEWFPAELVSESLPGQFRTWFYAMLTMSTILEGCSPFKTCIGHGDVLGEDGREMHKSWGNAIWFDEAVETMGADVMRWMYCTSRPESNLLFGYKKADDVKKRFLIPLWNIYSFFVTYANLDHWTPDKIISSPQPLLQNLRPPSPLDRWILSKLNMLIQDVTGKLDNYDPFKAAGFLEKFVEELSTWYVRRSRRRFWKSEKDEDKVNAYSTLFVCLTTLTRLLAPLIPFITEEMYQNLVRKADDDAPESVHHSDWLVADKTAIDKELLVNMDRAIKVCGLGRSARQKAGIKLRQPLSEAKVVAEEPVLEKLIGFKDVIIDELNVKNLSFTSKKNQLLEYIVRPLSRVLGKKYGKLLPEIRAALAKKDHKEIALTLLKGHSIAIRVRNQDITLQPKDVEVSTRPIAGYSLSEEDSIFVGVNTVVTDEL
ncbi:MAG: class I tRNA ligase family protein, partial [Candidatus Bathyarchaeota archaeon]